MYDCGRVIGGASGVTTCIGLETDSKACTYDQAEACRVALVALLNPKTAGSCDAVATVPSACEPCVEETLNP